MQLVQQFLRPMVLRGLHLGLRSTSRGRRRRASASILADAVAAAVHASSACRAPHGYTAAGRRAHAYMWSEEVHDHRVKQPCSSSDGGNRAHLATRVDADASRPALAALGATRIC